MFVLCNSIHLIWGQQISTFFHIFLLLVINLFCIGVTAIQGKWKSIETKNLAVTIYEPQLSMNNSFELQLNYWKTYKSHIEKKENKRNETNFSSHIHISRPKVSGGEITNHLWFWPQYFMKWISKYLFLLICDCKGLIGNGCNAFKPCTLPDRKLIVQA